MPRIDKPAPTTGPLKARAASQAPRETPAPKPAGDGISISMDARVKLGENQKPEVVLEGVTVEGDALEQHVEANVERNLRNVRKGLRAKVAEQVTEQVVQAIASQVAQAITPVMEQKLKDALEAENLPASLASQLTREVVPTITALVAEQLAKNVEISLKF